MTTLATPPSRLPAIDALRGVAILLVLGRHLPLRPDGTVGVLAPWQAVGWVGVDLFFVVSGYLIAGLLLREWDATGGVRVGRFLWRRAWRLYPAYWTLLLATLWWVHPTAFELGRQLLFLQNYWRPIAPGAALWGHTWSLAVEEHFYVLLPALVLLCRGRPRLLAWRVGVVALAVLVARLALRPVGEAGYFTHVRLDAPAIGVLLAALHHDPALAVPVTRWRRRWLPGGRLLGLGLLCAAPALVVPQNGSFMLAVGYSLLALGSAMVVRWALTQPTAWDGALATPLRAIGRGCYALYLVHQPWGRLVATLPLAWPAAVALYLLGRGAAAGARAAAVERPALAQRERWWPTLLPAPAGTLRVRTSSHRRHSKS